MRPARFELASLSQQGALHLTATVPPACARLRDSHPLLHAEQRYFVGFDRKKTASRPIRPLRERLNTSISDERAALRDCACAGCLLRGSRAELLRWARSPSFNGQWRG